MKNLTFFVQIIFYAIIGMLFTGCDQLKEDVLPQTTELIDLNQYEKTIYIMPGGEVVINIPSRLRASTNTMVTIGAEPKSGSLEFLSDGLLKYAAADSFRTGTDFFTLHVLKDSQILDQDTITIVIPSDTAQYPCWNGAMRDVMHFQHGALSPPFILDILANDSFCDSATINLTIFRQPNHGSAEIIDNLLYYNPNFSDAASTSLTDSLMYELCQPLEGGQLHCTLAKTIIYFHERDTCIINAVNDYHTIIADTLLSDTSYVALIDILANDQTCGNIKELSITQAAANGSAYIQDNKLYYSLSKQSIASDSLRYQICDFEDFCSEAMVRVDIQ